MKKLTLFFLLLLLFTGCQQPESEAGKNYSEDIEKIEQGLLPSILIEGEEVEPMTIQERMAHYKVPGVSIAFFENGNIQWTRTHGYLSNDSLQAVDENTRFQAASISKPVAGSGVLTLVEQENLDLDADVNTYLQEWKMPENGFTESEKVTLRGLLTHNAGLTVHGFRGYAADEAVPTTVQVLNGENPANSAPVLPDTFPGAIWRYSGGGYTGMQRLVEEMNGDAFPGFMQTAVLSPVGMKNSTYAQPLPASLHDNTANGHRGDGSPVEGKWHTYPEMAAAGLWTTPSDLARWALAVQKAYNGAEDRFISPETARRMLSKHANDWGLGPALGGEADSLWFSHGGSNEGYKCYLFAFAKTDGQGVAIMTNGDRGGNLYGEILRSVSKVCAWNQFEPEVKKVIPMNAKKKEEYTGLFKANEQWQIRLTLEGDELRAVQLWNQQPSVLYPDSTDRFFDIGDGTALRFFRKEGGEIEGFEVQGYRFEKEE